jgi:hypothetical protein
MLGGYLILLIMVSNFKIFQNQTIAGSDSFKTSSTQLVLMKEPVVFWAVDVSFFLNIEKNIVYIYHILRI